MAPQVSCCPMGVPAGINLPSSGRAQSTPALRSEPKLQIHQERFPGGPAGEVALIRRDLRAVTREVPISPKEPPPPTTASPPRGPANEYHPGRVLVVLSSQLIRENCCIEKSVCKNFRYEPRQA